MLNTVKVKNLGAGNRHDFTLGRKVADFSKGRLAATTPIGGPTGYSKGDIVKAGACGASEIGNLRNILLNMATIFTLLAAGEIPSYKVAENEDFYAFWT